MPIVNDCLIHIILLIGLSLFLSDCIYNIYRDGAADIVLKGQLADIHVELKRSRVILF